MTKIIGHRGARGLAAENSLEAITRALECRVDEIEVDVRVTSDGVPVLHHDPDIGQARIATHTLQQLLALRPNLAKLHDAIELVGGRVPLLIEVKPNEPIEPIVAVIQQHLSGKRTPHDFLVGSFQQKTLRALHAALPRIEPVVIESWSGVRASYRARQLHTKRVSMNARYLWFGFIRSMAHSGYKLAAYTVNEPSKAARWGKYGLYGVITDYPDRFKRTRDS